MNHEVKIKEGIIDEKRLLKNSFLVVNSNNSEDKNEKKFLPAIPAPKYLNYEELHNMLFSNKAAILSNHSLGFNRENGKVELMNSEADKEMKNVFTQIALKLGKSFFISNIQGLSLPAGFNEGRSDVDRSFDSFRISCIYMNKAASTQDKLERLKLVSIGYFAGLYLQFRMKKSFNPLLGETAEATLEDGSQLASEAISHHPPIIGVNCNGKDNSYKFSCLSAPTGSFKINYISVDIGVKAQLSFKDGHIIKVLNCPGFKVTGLIQGTRSSFWKGYLEAIDELTNMRSVVFIDIGKKKHYIGSEKTYPRDKIEGIIYESNNINISCNSKAARIEDLTDIKEKKVSISGSIFDRIDCDGKNYWHIDKIFPLKMIFESNPLPSDWRYREDLILVRRKEISSADKWKDAIEIRQRRDRKEREKYGKT